MKQFVKTLALAAICAAPTGLVAQSAQELQALAAFRTADVNSNGALNRKEFRVFITAMADSGHALAGKAVKYGAVGFNAAFKHADKNADSKVTIRELDAARR